MSLHTILHYYFQLYAYTTNTMSMRIFNVAKKAPKFYLPYVQMLCQVFLL